MTACIQGHVINGISVAPLSNEYIDVFDPVTGELAGKTAAGKANDIDAAVAAAKAAFPSWSQTLASERADILSTVALVLGANAEELIALECACAGVLASRLISLDLPGAAQIILNFADKLEDYPFIEYPPVRDLPELHDIKIIKQPLGVCGLIIPWNGPLFNFLLKTVTAVAAGNTVVCKPPETASLAVLRMAELLQDVFPPGVVNVVTGYGHEAGAALVAHPDVAKISFTGSTNTGRLIQKQAAETMKRVTLELGGKGPAIVLPDAPIELTARGACWGFALHSGQICVSGTRLFIHESIHDQVVERMVEILASLKPGSQLDPQTTLAPMAFRAHLKRVLAYIQSGKEEGATLACGGRRAQVPEFPDSLFVEPTIFTDVTPEMRIYNEEIFGPVLSVIKYSDVEDAIRMANNSCYGLASGVWSADTIAAQSVARRLETGTVWINEWHAMTTDISFGGVKQSGYGRELNVASMEAYLETKNYITSFEMDPNAKAAHALVFRNV